MARPAACSRSTRRRSTILQGSGRKSARIALVEAYAKAQGMFRTRLTPDPVFTDTLELDLGEVAPSLAGPKRPQDRVLLSEAKAGFATAMDKEFKQADTLASRYKVEDKNFDLGNGDVVIAAITSCTNTSNPSVMIAAGLVARNAVAKGLTVKPWVKTSLAPGSQVVADYLEAAELQKPLDKLGFNIVGYGCTTCIGNSGPLAPEISATIAKNNLVAAAVLSGNRNFEGRVNPDVRANYLASPPLVVAYALAGSMQIDLARDPIGNRQAGQAGLSRRHLALDRGDPSTSSSRRSRPRCSRRNTPACSTATPTGRRSRRRRGRPMPGRWAATYVQNPPYFEGMSMTPTPVTDIVGARILGLFLNSITTDHISPAGSIKLKSPAGPVSVRASGRAGRLQPVRHAARQP